MAIVGELPILDPRAGSPLRCPSAQADMEDVQVLGIVQEHDGAKRVAYVDAPVPLSTDLVQSCGEFVPHEVLRLSARCETAKCMHFDGTHCRLVERIVELMPKAVDTLPPCTIRDECRWFIQAGPPACLRCPQIVTVCEEPTPNLARIALGEVPAASPMMPGSNRRIGTARG
jgi:hypothetical protein